MGLTDQLRRSIVALHDQAGLGSIRRSALDAPTGAKGAFAFRWLAFRDVLCTVAALILVAVYVHKLDPLSPVLGWRTGWISSGTFMSPASFHPLVGPYGVPAQFC